MRIVIVQGMTCLGKTTLCKQLERDMPRCKHFSLDEYKEMMWDNFGFTSVEEREHLCKRARELFYSDIHYAVKTAEFDYILLDYPFVQKYEIELMDNLRNLEAVVKTVYLKPQDIKEHKKIWETRSRDFSVRHAGHGATRYHNGIGSGYVNKYDTKVFNNMLILGHTIEVLVSFNPYSLSVPYASIMEFISNGI